MQNAVKIIIVTLAGFINCVLVLKKGKWFSNTCKQIELNRHSKTSLVLYSPASLY